MYNLIRLVDLQFHCMIYELIHFAKIVLSEFVARRGFRLLCRRKSITYC